MSININDIKSLMCAQQEVQQQLKLTIENMYKQLTDNHSIVPRIQEYIILDEDRTYHIRIPNNDNIIITHIDTFEGLSDMILMHMATKDSRVSYKYFPELNMITKYDIGRSAYDTFEELANNREVLRRLLCKNTQSSN